MKFGKHIGVSWKLNLTTNACIDGQIFLFKLSSEKYQSLLAIDSAIRRKLDFGRSTLGHPCTDGDPCNGDFDCDNDCDGMDAVHFKADFGRSEFNSPCPTCIQGDWCSY